MKGNLIHLQRTWEMLLTAVRGFVAIENSDDAILFPQEH